MVIRRDVKMLKKTKVVVFMVLLLLIPVLKGVTVPPDLEPYAIYAFFVEIGGFWLVNIERLIGPIVGIF